MWGNSKNIISTSLRFQAEITKTYHLAAAPEPAVAAAALELVDVADAPLVVRLHLGRPEAARLPAVRAPHMASMPPLLHVVEELLGEGGLVVIRGVVVNLD